MLGFTTPLWLMLCAPLSALAGMYSQPVVHLDSKTWKSVMASEHASMVAFVAPWCGHCKNLGPEFTAAAKSLSPLIPFYAVDCDDDVNKRLCAEHNVKGFPTIKAFPRAGKGAARDYQGERKRGALVDYAKNLVPDRVKKLRADKGVEGTLSKFLEEKSDLPHVLLVHPSTPSIPFLWKVLGHRFSGKMHLGFIKDTTSHDVLTALGIYDPKDTTRETTRAVLWRPGVTNRKESTEYDGVLKFNGLLEWMQTHLPGAAHSKAQANENAKKDTKSSSDEAKARQAKLEEAERRDQERRAKQAQKQHIEDVGTQTDDYPPPQPEEVAEDEEAIGRLTETEGDGEPPAPEPVEAAEDEVESDEEGRIHEEL